MVNTYIGRYRWTPLRPDSLFNIVCYKDKHLPNSIKISKVSVKLRQILKYPWFLTNTYKFGQSGNYSPNHTGQEQMKIFQRMSFKILKICDSFLLSHANWRSDVITKLKVQIILLHLKRQKYYYLSWCLSANVDQFFDKDANYQLQTKFWFFVKRVNSHRLWVIEFFTNAKFLDCSYIILVFWIRYNW